MVGKAASSVFSNTVGRAGGAVLQGAAALRDTLVNNLVRASIGWGLLTLEAGDLRLKNLLFLCERQQGCVCLHM